MIQRIKKWLADNSNYAEGVEIYNKIKITGKHDKFFAQVKDAKPNSSHMKMLRQKISRLLTKVQADPKRFKISIEEEKKPISVKKVDLKPKKKKPQIINPEDLPDEIREKYKENKMLTAKIGTYHAKAKAEKDQEKRAELIKTAIELEDKKAENWTVIDDFINKGKKPEPDSGNKETKIVNLQRKLSNIRSNISRNERKLRKKPDHEHAADWKAKIDEAKKEKEELEQKMKKLEA